MHLEEKAEEVWRSKNGGGRWHIFERTTRAGLATGHNQLLIAATARLAAHAQEGVRLQVGPPAAMVVAPIVVRC